MLPCPLTNFEIRKYQNQPRFNGANLQKRSFTKSKGCGI